VIAMPLSPLPPSTASDTVLTFLESIGQRAEAEFYLKLFREVPKESFGLVAVENAVVRHALGSFVEHLRFLADLGLYAPVVLGLFGPGASDTTCDRLLKRLPAASLQAAVYRSDAPNLIEAVRADLRAERLPVVWFDRSQHRSQEARLSEAAAIARELGTQKLVYLRRSGGLRALSQTLGTPREHGLDLNNGTISVLNLQTEADSPLKGVHLNADDKNLLTAIGSLLTLTNQPRLMVNVASPLNLLKELFTAKGAGTLIKQGTLVRRFESYAPLDLPRLTALIEQSFGRQLLKDFFSEPLLAVYVESDYRGAAIVIDSPVGPYLSKFAVEPRARGEGIAQDVWSSVARDFPTLVWRARAQNPITAWYTRICSGMLRVQAWHVYWCGLRPKDIPAAIEHALGRASDFAD